MLSDSRRHCEEQSVFVHRDRRTSVFGAAGKIKIQSRMWLSDLHRVLHCWTAQGNKLAVMLFLLSKRSFALHCHTVKNFSANSHPVSKVNSYWLRYRDLLADWLFDHRVRVFVNLRKCPVENSLQRDYFL